MAKGYNATEYMYSSARIRSLEARIAGKEQIARLAEADSIESVIASLSDFGFEPILDGKGKLRREETLMAVLKAGLDAVSEMECGPATEFLKYQYDCNNIKAIIKCDAGGKDPDGMLLPLGSVSPEQAKAAFADKDYSAFPQNMAQAIAEAEEAFAVTANPQKIDFIIDRATFGDMLCAAERSGVSLALRLVETRIDLVNIMMAVRIIRMRLGVQGAALFDEAYIDGGGLNKTELVETLSVGDQALSGLLAYGRYSAMAELMETGASLGELEKKADDIWMDVARETKYLPFGAEIAIGYIVALEYEIKNIRIILAGKEAGLSSDIIRERLRESYV